uniref:Uncharacterized protein n=1 Tax=Lactuca sativa TaxID=4236 RepID=A0A9R1VS03_LACSA|nr:hypothetical protein LSAT_V11C400182750 [Lactuca sativa]
MQNGSIKADSPSPEYGLAESPTNTCSKTRPYSTSQDIDSPSPSRKLQDKYHGSNILEMRRYKKAPMKKVLVKKGPVKRSPMKKVPLNDAGRVRKFSKRITEIGIQKNVKVKYETGCNQDKHVTLE